jgi:hypothetical protein
MRAKWFFGIGLTILFLGLIGLLAAQQPAPPAASAQAPVFSPDTLAGEKNFVIGVQPTFTWFPDAPKLAVPEGYTPIFNGQNLTGWHASPTNHHGVTPDFHVLHGAIVGTQSPFGDGGILLTDKSYKNFDLYMEVKPDYGCDSGIFFRSTDSGHAYQITMDYLPAGGMGNLITETINGAGGTDRAAILAMRGQPPAPPPARTGQPPAGARAGGPGRGGPPVVGGIPLGLPGQPLGEAPWMKVWKREAWNSVRLRVEGDIPHVTVWINDQIVTDTQEKTNRAEGGMISGPIAIQLHGGTRWVQAGFWRWRNIGIKELP